MVLILTETREECVNSVIEWLFHYDCTFVRINSEDIVENVNISFVDNVRVLNLKYKSQNIDLSKIKSIWFRKGDFFYNNPNIKFNLDDLVLQKQVEYFLQNEWNTKATYFNYFLKYQTLISIGDNFQIKSNKLYALLEATKVGFKTPITIISDSKEIILKIFNVNDKIITKGIQEVFAIKKNTENWGTYTENITTESISEQSFFPSCFQELVVKKADIRVFYLDGYFDSFAIITDSQNVDFRKDYSGKQRCIPFKLPLDIQEKIHIMMKNMKMNTGSIDLVYSKDKEFYFLEVNPYGQYSGFSDECNYYIEKKIAQYLYV